MQIPVSPPILLEKTPAPRVAPALAIALAILAVSTAAIFIRFAQAEAPSLVIAAYRLGLSALFLAPIALSRGRTELAGLSIHQAGLALLSGLFLALHFAAWITSLEYTSVASSVVLVTTTPLWVALFSPIFLRERLSPVALVGMGVALVGGTVVALSDSCGVTAAGLHCDSLGAIFSGESFVGNFLALAGAWMAAGYLVVGRRLRSGMSLLVYTSLVYSAAAAALLGMVALAGLPLTGYSGPIYLWLAALALIPQLFGHTTFNWALKHVPAGFVSVFLLGEPIGSTFLAFLLLREAPSPLELAGGAVILIGIWISTRGDAKS